MMITQFVQHFTLVPRCKFRYGYMGIFNHRFQFGMTFSITVTFLVNCMVPIEAQATLCRYTIKANETLSEIAQAYVGEPVYPKDSGALARVLKLNPKIKDPHFVFVGERIILGESAEVQGCEFRKAIIVEQKAHKIVNRIIAQVVEQKTASLAAVQKPIIQQPVQQIENHADRFSMLDLSTGVFFTKVQGVEVLNGSRATLISGLNKFVDLFWIQNWSEYFKTHLNFGAEFVSINDSDTRTIQNQSPSISHFSIGSLYSVSDRFAVGASVSDRQELFYHAVTATSVKMDSVVTPQFDFHVKATLISLSPFALGVIGDYRYLTGVTTDNYITKAGSAYEGEVFLEQTFLNRKGVIHGGAFYAENHQGTSIVNQTRTDLGLRIGLSWSFSE